MNFLTGLKNFILGAPKVAVDVFDKDDGLLAKAGGFINDLHYSDVEKAEDLALFMQNVSDHIKTTLSESTERSRTRRALSILWIRVQLALILMVAICIPFNAKLAKDYYTLATSPVMVYGTTAVLIFFFGAYAWGMHIKKRE